jgi:hypothetical protein
MKKKITKNITKEYNTMKEESKRKSSPQQFTE